MILCKHYILYLVCAKIYLCKDFSLFIDSFLIKLTFLNHVVSGNFNNFWKFSKQDKNFEMFILTCHIKMTLDFYYKKLGIPVALRFAE